MKRTLDPEKYGMVLCPLCKGKGFVIIPVRQCCQKCGGFGLIKKEGKEDNIQDVLSKEILACSEEMQMVRLKRNKEMIRLSLGEEDNCS